jgi:TolB protein
MFNSNTNGNFDIWMVSADGGDPVALTDSSADEFGSDWSPDGSKILYNSNARGASYVGVINVNSKVTEILTSTDFDAGTALWSSDGLTHSLFFRRCRRHKIDGYASRRRGLTGIVQI